MGFRYSRNAYDRWASFRDEHAQLLAETGLPPFAHRSEACFRDLLHDGSTRSSAGEGAALESLVSEQWSALCRFAEVYFREFESWAPLDLFPAFRRETQRRD